MSEKKIINRLLINMRGKVDIINGAINHCNRLLNNESIILNGLHRIVISRGELTDHDLKKRIKELNDEKSNLLKKIDSMSYIKY